jgi:hypothetical protein
MPRTRLSPCKSQIPQRKTVDNCHTLPAEPPRYAFLLFPAFPALWSPFRGVLVGLLGLFTRSPGDRQCCWVLLGDAVWGWVGGGFLFAGWCVDVFFWF